MDSETTGVLTDEDNETDEGTKGGSAALQPGPSDFDDCTRIGTGSVGEREGSGVDTTDTVTEVDAMLVNSLEVNTAMGDSL